MDPIQLPEDLSSLSDEQVAELRSTAIPAYATHLRGQVSEHREAGEALPEALTAAIATLGEQGTRLETLVSERAAAAQSSTEAFAAADAALDAFGKKEDEMSSDTTTTDAAPEAGADQALTTEGSETPAVDAPAVPASAALSAADIGSIAATAAQAAVQALAAAQPAPAAPVPAQPAPSGTAAALAMARPGGVTPAAPTPTRPGRTPGEFMRTTAYALGQGIEPGQNLGDRLSVATAMNETLTRFQRSAPAAGVREFVPVATAAWERDYKITNDPIESMGSMVQGVYEAQQSLVASGECCTPLSPMYDFCRLAVPANPVESCLPSVQAPRGGITYIVTPDWRQAFAAIDEQCCGDNDDPANPVLKACSRVECPELETETVCAISWCAEFDNLQSRTFPELIDNYMEDLAVAYARRKEIHYLDRIHNASTAVSGGDTGYGASMQFIYNIGRAASGYRARNRMPENAMLNAMIPFWVKDAIKADHMFQAIREGAAAVCLSDGQVNALLTCWGVSPCWYKDSATGQDQAFDTVQAAGDLNAWPEEALVYLFSPGTFVRLDGGTLDVGLVRDSLLTRRNDFQMFFEEWIGLAQLCPESVALTIPMCANGAAPDLVAPFTC